ncbi:t-SNARE domain-containing protein 1 [Acipenser ruthenus]|uniref:t-SNARE domain-containing protein 1 n=1 Tax=Acipenser ruthenus TaxID=7906 RepID=A0A662YWR2_ACIRT|nr:t-SNARE domain-containing protein 1 [Acipenser ruthenus]
MLILSGHSAALPSSLSWGYGIAVVTGSSLSGLPVSITLFGHSTQQQTNKVITSTIQLIHQLSDIISSSSRQDHLRLARLRSELSESIQRYGDLQKKIAEKSRALLPPTQKDNRQYRVSQLPLEVRHSFVECSSFQDHPISKTTTPRTGKDSIEDYIQTTSSNVESANQELAKASHHQVTSLAVGKASLLHFCDKLFFI